MSHLNDHMKVALDEVVNGEFYRSPQWLKLRYKVMTHYGARCVCCGATAAHAQLHVDHIKPRSQYPELELDITNLQVLCRECNLGKGNMDQTDFRANARFISEQSWRQRNRDHYLRQEPIREANTSLERPEDYGWRETPFNTFFDC